MNAIRHWIAVPIFSAVILILGFGCATKSEKPKAQAPPAVSTPAPQPVPPATNTPSMTSTAAVYVPDLSHRGDPLPDGVLAWDELTKAVDAAADQAQAHFTFSLTNISAGNVAIVSVHPSCGCTTAQLPPMPWMLAPGANGQINLTVNLAGKSGTLFKSVNIATDKGSKTLTLRINILPPLIRNTMTDAERERGLMAAKADRQAVFKNDCATCHVRPGEGKYGKALYDAVCAICHEAEHRATMVPNLHTIKTPTNEQFWQVWIAHGKPGSLMPAFSTMDGGPLNDLQIASLAAYLNATIPSHTAP
jgi:mono/diheme cytochrome c family protein